MSIEKDSALHTVLVEMHKRVGAKYGDYDVSENDWYTKHKWTREEEDDFKKWFVEYLYNDNKARKQMTYCAKRKKDIKKAADWFVFNYGWSLKE